MLELLMNSLKMSSTTLHLKVNKNDFNSFKILN